MAIHSKAPKVPPQQACKMQAILKKYEEMITGSQDLTADDPPSAVFYILADKLSYLMDADAEIAISTKGV